MPITGAFPPEAQAFVDPNNPNTNYGASPYSIIGNDPLLVNGNCETWMRFNFAAQGINSTATINSVTLKNWFYYETSGGFYVVDLPIERSTDISWNEIVITYNNQPAVTGVNAGNMHLILDPSDPNYIGGPPTEVDNTTLTAMLQDAVATGKLSLRIKNDASQFPGFRISSRQYTNSFPKIIIDYTNGAGAPSGSVIFSSD